MIKSFITKTRWLVTIILLTTLCIGQMWGATVTLPFEWVVATNNSDAISYPSGVSQNSVGTYNSNYPYRLQFNANGDYVQINLNAAAEKVYFDIKKIGGSYDSKFKVQGCTESNGTYKDIEEFTISGSQNAIVKCATSNAINSSYRYIRIIKSAHGTGGNVGMGYIKITPPCQAVNVTGGSAVILPAGSTTYTANDWKAKLAPTTYAAEHTYYINSYCVTLTRAADYGNSNGLQFEALNGVLTLEDITSNYGVDIDIVVSGTNNFTVSLTGAASSVTGINKTLSISTTSTTADLTISKTTSSAGYVKYIQITPKSPAVSCTDDPTVGAASLNGSFW